MLSEDMNLDETVKEMKEIFIFKSKIKYPFRETKLKFLVKTKKLS